MSEHPMNPKARTAKMVIKFPMRGKCESSAFDSVPDGYALDMVNYLPVDVAGGRFRRRGGLRPNLSRAQAAPSTATNIDFLMQSPYINAGATAYKAVAISNQQLYLGADYSHLAVVGGAALLATGSGLPTMCDIFGKVYIAYGHATIIKVADLAAGTVANMAATAGTQPTGCRIAVNWRSRLCLSGDKANPQNIYMARPSTPTDFDYSQTDSQAAVALNASTTAGRVGDPVTALVPWTSDAMLIGCDRALYLMDGDPADNGTIRVVSQSIGMHSQTAWCLSPEGDLYFFGLGGFYRIRKGTTQVETLSAGRMEKTFNVWVGATTRLCMTYDPNLKGVWINTGANTLFYDVDGDGFFPCAFADATMTPNAMLTWHWFTGSAPDVVFGGTAGGIHAFINGFNSAQDFNVANVRVAASITTAPMRPAGFVGEAILSNVEVYGMEIVAGATTELTITANAGRSAAQTQVTDLGTPQRSWSKKISYSVAATAGRQVGIRRRLNGGAFSFTIAGPDGSATTAARGTFESIVLTFEKAGIQR